MNRFFTSFFCLQILLSAFALTSCSEENQVDATSQSTASDSQPVLCTVFSTGSSVNRVPKDGVNHTSMNVSRDFFWTAGDQIYVNTEGENYQMTDNCTLLGDGRRADFRLNDISLTEPTCTVLYIGNGTNSKTASKNDLKVKIEATQKQTAWGNSEHLGASGDCGVAEATWDETTRKYSFDLDHKAAYLMFQPYKAEQITANWKVMKIEIITDGTTKIAGTYDFGTGELVGTGTSDTVELNCNSTFYSREGSTGMQAPSTEFASGGFDLPSSASPTNSCFAVIAPGAHKLTIRYTIQPEESFRNYEDGFFRITKEISLRNYNPNGVTTIKHKLDVMHFEDVKYYTWDAPIDEPYDLHVSSTHANASTVVAPTQASRSCKDMPNANEMYWYIENGDPRWDLQTPWTNDKGKNVYTGGAWIMTKAAILEAGKTFDPNVGKDGIDMRVEYREHDVYSTTYRKGGRPKDTNKYFFLPILGHYEGNDLAFYYHVDYHRESDYDKILPWGEYWSSSSAPYNNPAKGEQTYKLFIHEDCISVWGWYRETYALPTHPEWFR